MLKERNSNILSNWNAGIIYNEYEKIPIGIQLCHHTFLNIAPISYSFQHSACEWEKTHWFGISQKGTFTIYQLGKHRCVHFYAMLHISFIRI